MAKRLHQTTADYVVVALSPALIMTLVGSLMYFLLAVFYRGDYPDRLRWVMACFVFASVLIGRISIEEGFERAAPFGIALAIAVGVAANQFVQFDGAGGLVAFSWVINWGLIALVWWCAHKLTWDCTVVDDSEDASGEGLLQVAGLEGRGAQSSATPNVEGTTSRELPAGWWQRYVEHQRRPHAPGVWVVYFSLAALPLFGFGQWFIPETDLAVRQSAFRLLTIYVASGLGLLVTTSFLGLRRYLRQRRVEMPTVMAGTWLGIGGAIIAALLVVSALLPRPNAEYAVSKLPFTVGSPGGKSSQYAPTSHEGADDGQRGPAPDTKEKEEPAEPDAPEGGRQPDGDQANSETKRRDPDGKPMPGESGEGGDGKSGSGSSKGGKSKGGSQGKQQSKSEGQEKSEAKSDSKGQGQQKSQDKNEPQQKQQDQQQGSEKPEQGPNESSDPQQVRPPAEGEREESQADKQQDKSSPASSPEQPPASKPFQPPQLPEMSLGGLADLLKWLFYAALALLVAYFAWRFRAEIMAAWRDFLAALRDLFGGRRPKLIGEAGPDKIKIPPQPFASFADPFATGIAARYSLAELVRYTLEAFEAWSREHGCEPQQGQTPHELARDVSRSNKQIAADARNLAELHARAAYARGELPQSAREQLERLWQSMHRDVGVPRGDHWSHLTPPAD